MVVQRPQRWPMVSQAARRTQAGHSVTSPSMNHLTVASPGSWSGQSPHRVQVNDGVRVTVTTSSGGGAGLKAGPGRSPGPAVPRRPGPVRSRRRLSAATTGASDVDGIRPSSDCGRRASSSWSMAAFRAGRRAVVGGVVMGAGFAGEVARSVTRSLLGCVGDGSRRRGDGCPVMGDGWSACSCSHPGPPRSVAGVTSGVRAGQSPVTSSRDGPSPLADRVGRRSWVTPQFTPSTPACDRCR